jgi:uncharacterized protein (UPF0548 family)
LADDRLATQPKARRALAELRNRDLNFDLRSFQALSEGGPWHVDDYCRELPAEPPGPPVSGGSFLIAQRLMSDYEFADPALVRALYDPNEPLQGRNMLLEIRFWMLRFRVGVRIDELYDKTKKIGGRQIRVWGWAYRTLEGHLERGQMDYEIWKWEDTGQVEFRIHAVSDVAEIRNPFVYLGFRLLGRRQQIRFARACGERMVRFTTAILERGEAAGPTPTMTGGLAESPTRL